MIFHFITVSLYAVYYRNIAFFLLWVLALSSVIGMVVFHFLQHRSLLKWAIGWSVSTLIIEILVCFPLLIVSTYIAISNIPPTSIYRLLELVRFLATFFYGDYVFYSPSNFGSLFSWFRCERHCSLTFCFLFYSGSSLLFFLSSPSSLSYLPFLLPF